MAEELRLDQLLGDCRAVDLHEALTLSRAVAMNRPRDELLPHSALAEQQHGRIGRRGALHRFEHRPQRRTLPDDLVLRLHRDLEVAVLGDELRLLEHVAQRDDHALGAERLVEEVHGARLDGLDGRRGGPMARNHDDREALVECMELPQHLHPIHPGHLDVEEHGVRPLRLHGGESVLSAGGAEELIVLVLEDHLQRVADGGFVVDDEDARLSQS